MQISFKFCSKISGICEKDVFPKRFEDNVTWSYFRHYIAENVCRTADFQTFEILCEPNSFVIM